MIKKKKPSLRKFGSAEYSNTPKTTQHLEFYKKTFESFNDKVQLARTFTHRKPNTKAKLKDF
jgi:hypothetical protein